MSGIHFRPYDDDSAQVKESVRGCVWQTLITDGNCSFDIKASKDFDGTYSTSDKTLGGYGDGGGPPCHYPQTTMPLVEVGKSNSLIVEPYGDVGLTHGLPIFKFAFTTSNQIPYEEGYFEITYPTTLVVDTPSTFYLTCDSHSECSGNLANVLVTEVSTGVLRISKLYRESNTRVAGATGTETADTEIVLLRHTPIEFTLQGLKYVDPVSSTTNSPIVF